MPTETTTPDDQQSRAAAPEYPVCSACASENVVCDAWASWSLQRQVWELNASFDESYCRDCDEPCKLEWRPYKETDLERTRRLNDEMRARIPVDGAEAYGVVMMTQGVSERGRAFVAAAARMVATFDAFTEDNDPYGEHDFGAFEIDGEKLFWKIDYYSLDMQGHSPDKSDLAVTRRVLTIMLASEY